MTRRKLTVTPEDQLISDEELVISNEELTTELESEILLEEENKEEVVVAKNSNPKPNIKKVFLSEEDKRILKKFNSHIVNKLGLRKTRSVKV